MRLAFDNETFLIGPAQLAPQLVCVSATFDGVDAEVIHFKDPACRRFAREVLEDQTLELGGQNVSYDLLVWAAVWPDLLELVFQAYDDDRVVDSQIRQKLIDIARGEYRGFQNGLTGVWVEYKYHLADLAKRHEYPVDLDKDTWRLRYHELFDTPVSEWPEGAVDYSRHDALSTFWVLQRQDEYGQFLVDQYRQTRAAWALHLMSAWGLRTDPRMVSRLDQLTRALLEDHKKVLLREGLLVAKKKGGFTKKEGKARELAQKAWEAKGGPPAAALTKGKKISLSEDAVELLGDPLLLAFQQYSSASTILDRVTELKAGVEMPIHTRFDSLMVSGRTSSSNPNIQARSTDVRVRAACEHLLVAKKTVCPTCDTPYLLAGDRESFVPRDGHVFLISDVPGLELRTIAQSCLYLLGKSRLAEVLNAGDDPHVEVAVDLLGIPREEGYRRKKQMDTDTEFYLARQTGKVVNFGLNARLGWRGLIQNARKSYGVALDEVGAKRAIASYYDTYPEMREFHNWVDAQCAQSGVGSVEHVFSGRIQGLVPPTVMSNTYSQGLGADATKAALYALVRECYLGRGPLWGSRPVNYIHDEYVTETLEERLDEKAHSYAEVISTEANRWLPDVPIPFEEMKPVVARRWSKKAYQVRNPDGTLGVWEWQDWLVSEAYHASRGR